jgi:hypothetical protein
VKKLNPDGQAEKLGVNVGDVIIEIEGTGVRGLPWSFINSEIITDAKTNVDGKRTRISIVFLRKKEQPTEEVRQEEPEDAVPAPAPYPFTSGASGSKAETETGAEANQKPRGRKMSWLQRAEAEEHAKEASETERVRQGGARRTSVLKQAGTRDGSVVEVMEDIPPPAPSNAQVDIPPPSPRPPSMPSIGEEMDEDTDDEAQARQDTQAVRKARKGSWIDALISRDQSELHKLKTSVENDNKLGQPSLNNDEGFLSDVFNSLDTAGNGVLKRVDLIKALRKNTKTLCELLKLPPRLSQSDGSMAVRLQ